MGNPSSEKTFEGFQRGVRRDISALERRLARRGFALPDRLGPTGKQTADWNSVLEPGFHWGVSAANQPPGTGTWSVGWALSHGDTPGLRIQQFARMFGGTNRLHSRASANGGTTWTPWSLDDPEDSDWVNITHVGTGFMQARRIGGEVCIVFNVTTSLASGATTNIAAVGAVPAQFRPVVGNAHGAVWMTGGFSAVALIRPDGSIGIPNQSGAARASCQGTATYFQ